MYAKIINENTKEVSVGLGTNISFYQSIGMSPMDVVQGYDGKWYLKGYAPAQPTPSYQEKRKSEYPEFSEQLDMIFWDKINGSDLWVKTIDTIKKKYPKS